MLNNEPLLHHGLSLARLPQVQGHTVNIYSFFVTGYKPIHFQGDFCRDVAGTSGTLQEGDWLGAKPGSCAHSSRVVVAAVPDEFSRSPTGEPCPSISSTSVVPVFQQWLGGLGCPTPAPCPSLLHSKHTSVCTTMLHLERMVHNGK